eukprot:3446982-Amphidinium_carterae.2
MASQFEHSLHQTMLEKEAMPFPQMQERDTGLQHYAHVIVPSKQTLRKLMGRLEHAKHAH